MKRLVPAIVAVSVAVAASACTAGAGAVPGTRSGGKAIEVAGALNKGRPRSSAVVTGVTSVSCGSAGNCAAGGTYADGSGHVQGFVATERDGEWGAAIEVPGLGALNTDGDAGVFSVSCGSAGNCAAVGHYADSRYAIQGFVATERDGRWGAATGVPGLAALSRGGGGNVVSVSCASAGNCAAGGTYEDHRGLQGFVVTERDGVWGRAIEVPGLAALNAVSGEAFVSSVSCASAGNCAAGGTYTDHHGHRQGFVAAERDGVWGAAAGVPGLGALNKGGNASVSSVSCASPGNCAASGDYTDRSGSYQGFVATESNGRWGTAIQVPGLAALDNGADAGTA
jgi:hypothetical protein